jgi:hypothetical protein
MRNRIAQRYLDGDIDKGYYQKKASDYKIQKEELYRKLKRIDNANDEFYLTIERVMQIAKDAPLLLERSTLEQRQEIINLVLQNLELKGDQLGWKYKKPFDLMASYKNYTSWLGWRDSNPRMPGPKPGALPLGHIPILKFCCSFTSVDGFGTGRTSQDTCYLLAALGQAWCLTTWPHPNIKILLQFYVCRRFWL